MLLKVFEESKVNTNCSHSLDQPVKLVIPFVSIYSYVYYPFQEMTRV